MHKRVLVALLVPVALLVLGLASSGCIFEDDECPEDQEPYYLMGAEGSAAETPASYHHDDEGKNDCPPDPRDSEPY